VFGNVLTCGTIAFRRARRLELLQRLSGTLLYESAVEAVSGTGTTILDTRTTPGLRALEKYAVWMGGAGIIVWLSDGVLIKENHISAAGCWELSVARRH
jgi:nicotinate-nucleotide pyrophosphorylase (carboxylating)